MFVRHIVTLCSLGAALSCSPLFAQLHVYPKSLRLQGALGRAQVVVIRSEPGGLQTDITRGVRYSVVNPAVARITDDGVVTAVGDGTSLLKIESADDAVEVPVTVTDVAKPLAIPFSTDVVPVFTKLGCNSGGCHGKAEGQAGFKLSVFGFDAVADHEALVKQNRGRRVNLLRPDSSLILQKATGRVPHGGGKRTSDTSRHYQLIRDWLRQGGAFDETVASLTSVTVEPQDAVLSPVGTQQLRVIAHYSDGRSSDVTDVAEFRSNADTVATVDDSGQIRGKNIVGEAAVLVRYLDKLSVCRVRIPRTETKFQRPPENNFVDRIVWDKLQKLGIQPSTLCDDATFLRRVYLDTIGTLPTPIEAREFLADQSADKREAVIHRLLQRDEYAVLQALKWSDLLRLDGNALGPESSVAFTRWLRKQFRENRPYDEFVSEIVTATGSTRSESPAALYLTLNKPKELGSSISQLFLGVRIECAECHHHPFEKWSQGDFYSFAGLFTGVVQKNMPSGAKAIITKAGTDLKHPKTNEPAQAKGLGEAQNEQPRDKDAFDGRQHLANWMTRDTNPFFSRAIANRIWSFYFHRGLVDPVDDLRDTNPASNEELLAALADFLRANDFDLKLLTETILTSRVYQLSSQTNETNIDDQQNFSHFIHRALPAEVLLDAICQTTGVPEKFNGWPIGARAIEVWDNRMPSYFFRIFGRPTRTTVCACERGDAPSISQALHLLNSPEISQKIQHRNGRARQLSKQSISADQVIDELYLTAVSRYPTDSERKLFGRTLNESDSEDRTAAIEDLLWTLLNTREFLFNH